MSNDALVGFRLSPQQTRLWRLAGQGLSATTQIAFMVEGEIDVESVRRRTADAVERHEILRTTFPRLPGMELPLQVVLDDPGFGWRQTEAGDESEPRKRALEILTEERLSGFDLEKGPLLRVAFVALAPRLGLLVLSTPALVADLASLRVLAAELVGGGTGDEPLQYVQFSEWRAEELTGEDVRPAIEFWSEQQVFTRAAGRLPFESEPPDGPLALARHVRSPDPALGEAVARGLAAGLAAEPFFLACWAALLWRLGDDLRPVVGRIGDGRVYEELEGALGPYEQCLPVPLELAPERAFDEVVSRIERHLEEVTDLEDGFYAAYGGSTEIEGAAMPHLSFGFELRDLSPISAGGGAHLVPLVHHATSDYFPLQLMVVRSEGAIELVFAYDARRFEAAALDELGERFAAVVTSAAERPSRRLDELDYLAPAERRWLLGEANATERPLAEEALAAAVGRWAGEDPDAVAAEAGPRRLTYGELDRAAGRLADVLARRGAAPERIVGICLERSPDLVTAIVAVLRSGAAYLPLDPAFPDERLAFLLADADVELVVASAAEGRRLAALDAGREIELVDPGEVGEEPGEPLGPAREGDPGRLAYVIYTSGSTGRPKGTMISRRALANYLGWARRVYGVDKGAGSLLHSSVAFDLSLTSLLTPLSAGRKVGLLSEGGGADALAEALASGERQSFLKLSPAHLRVLRRALESQDLAACTAGLVLGGDALLAEDLAAWRERAPTLEIWNEYGPTEATVGCCVHRVPARLPDAGPVPIGHPIDNTRLYVADPGLRLLPCGVAGELLIGGTGLARGYYRRPGLTAERFIPDPFGASGERLYRSGDRVRRLASGELEFLGRLDGQVKIRGFRVELGEVESALTAHPKVSEAAVLAPEDSPGERRLVAFVVSAGDPMPGRDELYRHCREQLPEFMVPSSFLFLDFLPLTAHGKIDRQALAERCRELEREGERLTPGSLEEEVLAGVFCQVLRRERVGVDENFFTIGGDSIRSIEVVALAQDRGLEFSADDLFNSPTIRQLARRIHDREVTSAEVLETAPFSLVSAEDRARMPEEIEDAYPLTRLQAGMIFHAEYGPDQPLYHDIASVHMRAPIALEPSAIAGSIERLLERHPVLRTSFDLVSFSQPLQLVHERGVVEFELEDLRHLDAEEQEKVIAEWMAAEKRRGFDVSKLPLMRFHFHLRSQDTFQVSLGFHHAILDGWSDASMLTELFADYIATADGRSSLLSAPVTKFRDFVALERKALEEYGEYWDEILEDSAPMRLPRWRPVVAESGEGEVFVIEVDLDDELSYGLPKLALALAVPLKDVLLAAHLRVLSFLAGQPDALSCVVASGRPDTQDGERVMGLFINSMPFRLRLDGGSWEELVMDTFETERELLPIRRYPMAELKRQRGGTLSETLFYYTHYHIYLGLESIDGVEVLEYNFFEQTSFPLMVNFSLYPFTHRVGLRLKCDPGFVTPAQARFLADTYRRVLAAMVADPSASYDRADLLSPAERHQLTVEWPHPAAAGTRASSEPRLEDLVAAAGRKRPEAVAVSAGDTQLSYGELLRRAATLGRQLRSLGVAAEERVGLVLERSAAMPAALLGILEAGAAYVPIDPALPRERVAFMLEDAGVAALVSERRLIDSLPASAAPIVAVEEVSDPERADGYAGSPRPADLAYVIYTSGSTGRPKGVEIEHRSLVGFLAAMRSRIGFEAEDAMLAVTTLSFDIAGLELFLPLAHGGRVELAQTRTAADGDELARRLAAVRATFLQSTPTAWRLLLDSGWRPAPWLTMLSGGETLPRELSDRLLIGGGTLWNLYGPTETTIWSSAERRVAGSVTIGRALDGNRLYVLDPALAPLPVAVAGELCLGGTSLARGYHGQPALTAERFAPDPIGGVPGARLYRTGDQARFAVDGRVEFLGRLDHQVKVRGFRIELGEIEMLLSSHPAVDACVAVVRSEETGEPRLVAYFVASGERRTTSELRAFLARRLPDYMLPAIFVPLDELPLSPSGKIDRRALPAPDSVRPELDRPYLAPRTEVERQLATVFGELLRIDQVGVEDNFFEIGGDSIASVQAVARAARLGLQITPRQIFEHPTIAALAQVAGTRPTIVAEQGPIVGPVPLTPIQRWFFDAEPADPDHFNQALALELGRAGDPALLERALACILDHHDALRLCFEETSSGWRQTIAAPGQGVPFLRCDLSRLLKDASEAGFAAVAASLQASLDLGREPLVRAAWFRFGETRENRLLIVAHHLVIDGVSWRILLEDLAVAYRRLSQGREVELPPKSSSYRRWAVRLEEAARSPRILAEADHWRSLAGSSSESLPVDFAGGRNDVAAAASVRVSLAPEETRALLDEVPRAYRTRLDEVLLAALLTACGRWSGRRVLTVDLEGHGRQELFEDLDLSRTVGWFTAVYPVRLEAGDDDGPGELLAKVKEAVRVAPAAGIGFGLLRYLGPPEIAAELAALPRVQVAFNYLGQLEAGLGTTLPWRRSPADAGPARSPRQERRHLLEIGAFIARGRLEVGFGYSSGLHQRATIEALASEFLAALRELVEHCRSPQAGTLTPSDFGRARLTQDKLARILAEVEGA